MIWGRIWKTAPYFKREIVSENSSSSQDPQDQFKTEFPTTPEQIKQLTSQEKIRLAISLRRQGYNVEEISKHLHVCKKTVYNYLNKAREHRLEELESCKSIDVLIENLDSIESLEQLCMKFALDMADEKRLDPLTGEIIPKRGSPRDRAEMLRLVRDFVKMRVDLLQKSGVLPSSADKIYDVLAKNNKLESESEAKEETRPELQKRVMDRLSREFYLDS